MVILLGLIIGNALIFIFSLIFERIFPIFNRLDIAAEKYKTSVVTFKKRKNTMSEISSYKDVASKIVVITHLQPLMKRYRTNLKASVTYTFLAYLLIGVYETIQIMDGAVPLFDSLDVNIPLLAFLFYFSTLFIIGYEMRKILILNNI